MLSSAFPSATDKYADMLHTLEKASQAETPTRRWVLWSEGQISKVHAAALPRSSGPEPSPQQGRGRQEVKD